MNLKYLNTFITVVTEGSFSKAAAKLNYTQSTITFQIRKLEEELGTVLFEKIGRKMVLTKAGKQLIPYVDDVMDSVSRLRDFSGDRLDYEEDIHVGIAETMLCYRMAPVLEKFSGAAPKASLSVRSMVCYDIRDALINGTLDIGVFYDYVGGFRGSLVTKPIMDCPLAIVASPSVRNEMHDLTSAHQEVSVPFITNEPNCVFRQIFEDYLRRKSIEIDRTTEVWSVPTIKTLLLGGAGFSYLPKFTVKNELDSGSLVTVPSDLDGVSITAVYAYHKNKWISPIMEKFTELCCEISEENTQGDLEVLEV